MYLTLGERLKKEIDLSLPENDPEVEAEALSTVIDLIYKAKHPIVLADACCVRHGVVPETHRLLEKLKIPGFVTPMGKSAINETNAYYGGVYLGEISQPAVRKAVEDSDCVLSIGAILSDFNTVLLFLMELIRKGSFSYHISKDRTIEFHSTWTKVGNTR
jgi:pyruvate decarboxylase